MSTRYHRVMASFVKKALKSINGRPSLQELRKLILKEEARIGGNLFGAVPTGGRRDFFRVDRQSWAWNEVSPNGAVTTVRYVVSDSAVTAIQDNHPHRVVRGQELQNFLAAIETYAREVRAMYATLPR